MTTLLALDASVRQPPTHAYLTHRLRGVILYFGKRDTREGKTIETTQDSGAQPDARRDAATPHATPPQHVSRGLTSSARMSPRLVLVFAVATGLVVANNYYAQPILNTIAREFHSTAGEAGLIVTMSQVGYALGLLFVLPLADVLDRRRLIITVLGGTTLSLVAAALAPSMTLLIAVSLAVGVTSVVAQVLVPFAASLASSAERGRIVGTVMSGLLLGILLARTFSGLVTQVAGWRAVYWVAAVLMLAVIVVLWRELPRVPRAAEGLSYGQLLASVVHLARTEPVLRRRSIYGALTFATFSVFWTTMAFLLARPPYRFGEAVIGLFGIAGVAGALCASIAGRLADRGWSRATTGVALLLVLASYGLLALGARNLVALILGVVVLDMGAQGTHITNQSEIYRLHPEASSRLNAVYMTAYFIGGAIGSATAGAIYVRAGWPGVCILGAVYPLIALAYWLTELRHGGLGLRPRG